MHPMTFGAATSDRASATPMTAPVTNLMPLTVWAWIRPSAFNNGRAIFSTNANDSGGAPTDRGFRLFTVRASGVVRITVDMSGTDVDGLSNTGLIDLSRWWFVAATVDSSFVPRVYAGTEVTPVVEATYSTQTTGTTGTVTDAGYLKIGNRHGNGFAFQGEIAVVGYMRTAASLATLWTIRTGSWQQLHEPTLRLGVPNCVGLWRPGFSGGVMVQDESGNGNHGLVTGAVPSGSTIPRTYVNSLTE